MLFNSRTAQYDNLLPQAKALFEGESSTVANMANLCALLKETFGFFWVGFYTVEKVAEAASTAEVLVLGPFQGPVACTRIAKGRGVCGTAWVQEKTLIVPDVDAFPGHIACNAKSRSEIVVPVFKEGRVVAVLDIDHNLLNHFTTEDAAGLEALTKLLF